MAIHYKSQRPKSLRLIPFSTKRYTQAIVPQHCHIVNIESDEVCEVQSG